MSTSARRRVVVDTDAGTDPDDLMALALLAGRPDVDLVAVTTVYGDTVLRARIVRALLAGCGAGHVPVIAGAGEPLSGADVWWAGHEGRAWADLMAPAQPGDGDPRAAAHLLAETVSADPGGVDVVAIGPLTNLAAALDLSPGLAEDLRGLWVMGGDFSPAPGGAPPEHNLRSDAVAAAAVLGSRAPTVLTGLDVTRQVTTQRADVEAIASAGPIGAVLAEEIAGWWEHWHEDHGVPHDPVAVLTMLEPGLVRLGEPGAVEVGDDGAARHRPVPEGGVAPEGAGPAGTVRVAVGVDADAAARAVHSGVVAGLRRDEPGPR